MCFQREEIMIYYSERPSQAEPAFLQIAGASKCRASQWTLEWDTRFAHPNATPEWDTRMGHPNGTPEWDTRMGHPNGTPEWDTRMGHPNGTPDRGTGMDVGIHARAAHELSMQSLLTLRFSPPWLRAKRRSGILPAPPRSTFRQLPLMVHFSNFHPYIPIEIGNSGSSKSATWPFLPAIWKTMRRPLCADHNGGRRRQWRVSNDLACLGQEFGHRLGFSHPY